MMSEELLDVWAEQLGVKRPEHGCMKFATLKELVDLVDHEGFMIRSLSGEILMKIKSPHYLSKKALMRMGKRAVDQMFDNPEQFRQRLDEEFYEICEQILKEHTKEEWAAKSEQERREYIEAWFLCAALFEGKLK